MASIASSVTSIALAVAALAASAAPTEAATVLPYAGVGQHRTVMNSIAGTQRRNNAVLNHVQGNIRAAQRRRY